MNSNLCSRNFEHSPISVPLIRAQMIVPHFTPRNTPKPKKMNERITPMRQEQMSYPVLKGLRITQRTLLLPFTITTRTSDPKEAEKILDAIEIYIQNKIKH